MKIRVGIKEKFSDNTHELSEGTSISYSIKKNYRTMRSTIIGPQMVLRGEDPRDFFGPTYDKTTHTFKSQLPTDYDLIIKSSIDDDIKYLMSLIENGTQFSILFFDEDEKSGMVFRLCALYSSHDTLTIEQPLKAKFEGIFCGIEEIEKIGKVKVCQNKQLKE